MELGLSLGDAPKPLKLLEKSSEQQLQNKTSFENGGPNLCVALGLKTYSAESGGPEKNQTKYQESEDEDDDPNSVEEENTDFMSKNNSDEKTPVQLNLLPQVPVPRRISLPWVSDNGSSENGSSGNVGLPAARGPGINRAAEEVSSANSVGSAFRLDFVGGKRDFEAGQNDDVAMSDDESGPHSRKKLRLSKQQSAFLEETFKDHNTLNPKQKLALAKQLNLRPRQVEVWFQNRRARTKLKQTEVDCEYLKRCCETLSDENRRLQKELQELRALKISNPFCMQSPATTLTMCPSCERVASASAPPPSAAAGAGKIGKTESIPKAIPFALNRPKFFPFSQNSVRHPHNRPAAL